VRLTAAQCPKKKKEKKKGVFLEYTFPEATMPSNENLGPLAIGGSVGLGSYDVASLKVQ
jgi:hypothetical protein